jgi:hypothetical protein
MEVFIRPALKGELIRHLNDVACDNRVVNLCYGSPSVNAQDKLNNWGKVRPVVQARKILYITTGGKRSTKKIHTIVMPDGSPCRWFEFVNGRIESAY